MAKMSKAATKGAAETILGAIAGGVASKILVKQLPIENPMIKALIPLGAGFVLSMNKNKMLQGVGIGMAVTGGTELVTALVPGIGEAMLETIEAPEVPETIFIEAPDDEMGQGEYMTNQEILSAPADQSILSAPADQSILSEFEEINGGGVFDFAAYESNYEA